MARNLSRRSMHILPMARTLEYLRMVFDWCRLNKISLNPLKCQFWVRHGVILGHVVSRNGISMDFNKIKLILELPLPTNFKGVQWFTGHKGIIGDSSMSQIVWWGDLLKLLCQTHTVHTRRSSLKNTQREMEAKTFSCWFFLLLPHTLQCTQSTDKIQHKGKLPTKSNSA